MLAKVGRLRELRIAVKAENRKGFGMMTGILKEGSTGARTLPMASNKVLPEIPIPSWLLAASKTRRHCLDFLSTAEILAPIRLLFRFLIE